MAQFGVRCVIDDSAVIDETAQLGSTCVVEAGVKIESGRTFSHWIEGTSVCSTQMRRSATT
eukprot:6461717-Prymnesium_polylepis.1